MSVAGLAILYPPSSILSFQRGSAYPGPTFRAGMPTMKTTPRDSERQSLVERCRQFFYAEETPFGLALTRMFLPIPLLITMATRWPYARELFSTDGASTPIWNSYHWPNLLPEIPGTVAVMLISVLIVSLITLSIGWCTRASAVISFVLYTYLTCLDAISTMTKYSVIASHILLLLSISHCGVVWSVDAWLKRRRSRHGLTVPGDAAPRFAVWPRRLVQLLLGFVYFGAAVTKLHTPAYFNSDQLLSWFLTNVNNDNPLGEYLTLFPAMLVMFAYIAVVWELMFLFLAWRGFGRKAMLLMGVVFHIMTTFTLGLYIFPMVCLAAYCAFLNEEDVQWFALAFRRMKRRFAGSPQRATGPQGQGLIAGWIERSPLPAPVGFVLLLAIVSLGAIEVEYRLDPYGKRRPEGPHALKQLDTEYVETVLLAPPTTIRPRDMVWGLKAGTIVIGGHIADPRRQIRQGEVVTVQFNVNPPHKDVFVQCTLNDADDNIIMSRNEPVPRETTRVSWGFPISTALEPGEYSFVLKCQGVKVQRHKVRILRQRGRLSAN